MKGRAGERLFPAYRLEPSVPSGVIKVVVKMRFRVERFDIDISANKRS